MTVENETNEMIICVRVYVAVDSEDKLMSHPRNSKNPNNKH